MAALEFGMRILQLGPRAYVFGLSGELDGVNSHTVHDELTGLEERGARHVVVDLTRVTFLEPTAVGLLLAAAQRLDEQGGELVLVADDPRTLRIFEVTGLLRQLRLERTLGAAVSAVTAD